MKTIETMVAKMIRDGQDPVAYRLGLAEAYGVTAEQIDAIIIAIKAGPAIAQISPEAVAQERLSEQRRARKVDPRGARRFDHEE